MNVLAVISPALKALFERVGKPEVVQPAQLSSVRRGRGGHRLQPRWLGGQPVDGLCRVPQTATIYVKRGIVRLNAIAMGLEEWRFCSD